MSAYLKFFELEQSPFEGKAQSSVVLGTRALREAFGKIETGLADGVSRICVSGAPGLGKTSLARALPKLLGDSARVALVLDPALSWEGQRNRIAKQWGLEASGLARARLLEASRGHRLVLVIDQAETADEEFLGHLDVVLSYRNEEDQPVIQSVLLARLGALTGEGGQPSPLVWWLDRIQTLQLEFAPLPRDGIESYVHKHLKRAGWRGDRLFTLDASHAIHGYTGGVPGAVSDLCEKLLSEAATRDLKEIDAPLVHSYCDAEVANEHEGWTLQDEFEELVLEEEFATADAATCDADDGSQPSTPPLSQTLEHFEDDSAQEEAGEQASVTEFDEEESDCESAEGAHEESEPETAAVQLAAGDGPEEEDPLYALPSEEELRAIRGHFLSRNLRSIAAAASASLIGGLLLSYFGSAPSPDPSTPPASSTPPLARASDGPARSDLAARALDPEVDPFHASPLDTPPVAENPRVLIGPGGGFVTTESSSRNEEEMSDDLIEPGESDSIGTPPERAGVDDPMDNPEQRGQNPSSDSLATQPAALAPTAPLPLEPDSEVRFW